MSNTFERHVQSKPVKKNASVGKGVGKAVRGVVNADVSKGVGIQQKQPPQKNNEVVDQAPVMGGVQTRPSKIPGAFYLQVNADEPQTAWTGITDTVSRVSLTDTTVMDDENYVAYSLKYFQNTFALARSMLCYVEGDDALLLEINRMEGDGFGFADLFVKEFSNELGDLCSKPVFVEDPEIQQKQIEHQDEEFLDLSADVGEEMIEHWLSALRPAGGIKYNAERIYDALSSLGWNCQDPTNYERLKEYVDDIVEPIFSIFLRQEGKDSVGVDHIPSVFYACKILNQFAVQGDIELTNVTVASLCAMGLRYCDPENGQESVHKIKTSKQSLHLIFETLETIASKIPENAERDEDMVDAMKNFCQSCASMFGDNSMEVRIGQLAQNLQVSIEEDLA